MKYADAEKKLDNLIVLMERVEENADEAKTVFINFQTRLDELRSALREKHDTLVKINDYAHENSNGHDALWAVREMANSVLSR